MLPHRIRTDGFVTPCNPTRATTARRCSGRARGCGEGRMNINTGKPWSDMDLADLANALTFCTPIEEIAVFLCRDVDEVREKIAALASRLDGYE